MGTAKKLFKNIKKKYLDDLLKCVPNITGIEDILGEKNPGEINKATILFHILPRLYGRLLDNDPRKTLSRRSISFRQKCFCGIIRKGGGVFLGDKELIIEKNFLSPKEVPTIFASNHGFFEDAVTISLATQRNAYYMFGNIPTAFNSLIGLMLYFNGFILVNRRDKSSKRASIEKAIYALGLGTNIYFYPEGVWNKTANQLTLNFWSGIIQIARGAKAPIVPVVQLLVENRIYLSILEPFEVWNYDEFETDTALETLRTTYNTELMELMEKYAQVKRDDLLGAYESMTDMYEAYLEKLVSANEGLYDYQIERNAAYQSKEIALPEDVWKPVSRLDVTPQNVQMIMYARQLVEERQRENFQRRF